MAFRRAITNNLKDVEIPAVARKGMLDYFSTNHLGRRGMMKLLHFSINALRLDTSVSAEHDAKVDEKDTSARPGTPKRGNNASDRADKKAKQPKARDRELLLLADRTPEMKVAKKGLNKNLALGSKCRYADECQFKLCPYTGHT